MLLKRFTNTGSGSVAVARCFGFGLNPDWGGGGSGKIYPQKKKPKRSFMLSTAGIPLRMDRCFLCSLEVLHGGREMDLSQLSIILSFSSGRSVGESDPHVFGPT